MHWAFDIDDDDDDDDATNNDDGNNNNNNDGNKDDGASPHALRSTPNRGSSSGSGSVTKKGLGPGSQSGFGSGLGGAGSGASREGASGRSDVNEKAAKRRVYFAKFDEFCGQFLEATEGGSLGGGPGVFGGGSLGGFSEVGKEGGMEGGGSVPLGDGGGVVNWEAKVTEAERASIRSMLLHMTFPHTPSVGTHNHKEQGLAPGPGLGLGLASGAGLALNKSQKLDVALEVTRRLGRAYKVGWSPYVTITPLSEPNPPALPLIPSFTPFITPSH